MQNAQDFKVHLSGWQVIIECTSVGPMRHDGLQATKLTSIVHTFISIFLTTKLTCIFVGAKPKLLPHVCAPFPN